MEPTSVRRVKTLLAIFGIGIPYTIFYYPLDIYGWRPVRIFSIAAILITAIFWRWKSRKHLKHRRRKTPEYYEMHRERINTILWVAGIALVLFTGLFWLIVGNVVFQGIRFVVQPVFYVAIMWSLSRSFFIASLAVSIAAGAGAGIFRRGRRRAAWGAFIALWTLICISLVFFSAFKAGPGNATCADIRAMPGVRLLLSRERINSFSALKGALPYDAVTDDSTGSLFVSLKQTSSKPGGIIRIDLASGAVKSIITTDLPNKGRLNPNEFPERLSINPARKELYALVLSPGNNHLFIISYEGSLLQAAHLVKLEGEPNNVYADIPRNRIFVFYAGATKHGFAVYNADTAALVTEVTTPEMKGSIQHIAPDPATGHFFISNIGPGKIMEIDPANLSVVRTLKQFNAVEGIAYSETERKLYAAEPITRKLDIIAPGALIKTGQATIDCGLADLAYDEKSRTVAVAGYTGVIDIVSADSPWKTINTIRLGWLLRNISNSSNGRFFACSGCGVFEIVPGALAGGK